MENPITLEQERKVWTIHQSVKGLTYYYNRATKKSQFEMPQCFKLTEEQLDHPEWKEYRTAEGQKFYYNATTRKSNWQLPNQVKQYRQKKQEEKRKEREANGGKLIQQQKLSEGEQQKKAFMTLLKHKSVNLNTKWDSCVKLCIDDDRWNILKNSDKKKYYNEYMSLLKNKDQIQKKEKTEVNKGIFIKMLRQKTLSSDCKMHKVSLDLITDPRWKLLEGTERQNAFQQYMDQLAIKQKEQQKQNKKINSQNLRKCMEDDMIKYNTKWEDFRKLYDNNPYYKALHPYQRITTFVDYIIEAQKKHEEQTIKDKKLAERVNRINFRNFVRQKLLIGQISYKTKWRSFVKDNQSSQQLLNMMDPQQPGTSAHQIFEYILDQVRQNHKSIKASIKHHFKKKGFKMAEETSREEFLSKLADLQLFVGLKPFLKDYFYSYFQQKIKSKNLSRQHHLKKNTKRQKKIVFKVFKQLKDIQNKYSIEGHMDQIEKGLQDQGLQLTHENILKYYLQYLQGNQEDKKKRKDDKSPSDSDSDDNRKRKKKDEDDDRDKNRKNISMNPGNDYQEQGEIKDEQLEDRDKKKKKNKASKKNKNRSRSKSRSSSSDSD